MITNRVVLLSHPINEQTPAYGNSPSFNRKQTKSIINGDTCNSHEITLNGHFSTHVDCPLHFIEGGKSITDYKTEHWIFQNAKLVNHQTSPDELIDFRIQTHLSIIEMASIDLLLIKTDFEKHRKTDLYWSSNPGLAPSLAETLRTNCPKLRAVGLDSISISSWNNRELGRASHREFLSRDLLLIEDMHLNHITTAPDLIIVSPLMVSNIDGSPASVWGLYSNAH